MTPVAPFLPSAPAGQTVTHLGSPHWRHSASSNALLAAAPVSAAALGMIWISERRTSSDSNLAPAQAFMHSPQPSHLDASKAMVE